MTSISIVVRSYVHLLTLPEQTVYTLCTIICTFINFAWADCLHFMSRCCKHE